MGIFKRGVICKFGRQLNLHKLFIFLPNRNYMWHLRIHVNCHLGIDKTKLMILFLNSIHEQFKEAFLLLQSKEKKAFSSRFMRMVIYLHVFVVRLYCPILSLLIFLTLFSWLNWKWHSLFEVIRIGTTYYRIVIRANL